MSDFQADQSSTRPYGILIDRDSPSSMLSQTVEALRTAIRSRHIPAGSRLPPTRDLGRELGISRSVVVAAYEQLEAEGYLEGRVGSGTYVVEGAAAEAERPRGEELADSGRGVPGRFFYRSWPGEGIVEFDGASACPEPELFPKEEWTRCLTLAARGIASCGASSGDAASGYDFGDVAGNRALRRAIAGYLFRMKGMSCSEDEIIVTAGSSQAALLLGTFLHDGFAAFQVEDPTYPPLRSILRRMGLRPRPIAIDGQGLPAEAIDGELPLLATPAHHFPTGVLLPAERREAIAAKVRAGGSIVIEDDYDGELRFRGLPVRPLRAIAPDRVILMGSFSKVMYPGLRLGYLVAPQRLVDRLLGIKFGLALWADSLAQAALARFIDEGRLDRRLRRIKRDCAAKRELIEELAKSMPGGPALVRGEACGMHLRLAFPGGLPADFNRSETAKAGFVASRISSFSILPDAGGEEALLIGYGSISAQEIKTGFGRMAAYIAAEGRRALP